MIPRALLLLVAACSSDYHRVWPPIVDAPLQALDLDVVVSPGHVALYTNYSDIRGQCNGGGSRFPAIGEYILYSDAPSCADIGRPYDCITQVAVESAGTFVVADGDGLYGFSIAADVTTATEANLLVTGCGGLARIPIGSLSYPVPSGQATYNQAAGSVDVTWSADIAPASSLVTITDGDWWAAGHVTGTHDVVDVSRMPLAPFAAVIVTTYSDMQPVDTDFGTVRVWPGTAAQLPLTFQ